MGISGLLPALKSIQKPRQLKDFAGQTIAIDAYGWLHKGTVTCTVDLVLGKPTKRHIEYCMRLIRMLQHFKVIPYVVFDGDYLPSKAHTEAERKAKREKSKALGKELLNAGKVAAAHTEFQKAVDVTPEMAHQFIVELRKAGVQFVVAPYEADAQMVYLERKGKVTAILSEDSDLLVFGAKCLLTKLDKYGNCIEVNQKDFTACKDLSLIGWTEREFRHMAILSGCDYLPSIKGLGLKTAHRLLRRHKTVEQVVRILRFDGKYSVPKDYLEGFHRAEITFLHQRVYCPDKGEAVYHTPPPQPLEAQTTIFIGKSITTKDARAIARGLVNPITRKTFKMVLHGRTASGSIVDYADDLDHLTDHQLYGASPYDLTNTNVENIINRHNSNFGTPQRNSSSAGMRTPLGDLPTTFNSTPAQDALLARQGASDGYLSSPTSYPLLDDGETPSPRRSFSVFSDGTAREDAASKRARTIATTSTDQVSQYFNTTPTAADRPDTLMPDAPAIPMVPIIVLDAPQGEAAVASPTLRDQLGYPIGNPMFPVLAHSRTISLRRNLSAPSVNLTGDSTGFYPTPESATFPANDYEGFVLDELRNAAIIGSETALPVVTADEFASLSPLSDVADVVSTHGSEDLMSQDTEGMLDIQNSPELGSVEVAEDPCLPDDPYAIMSAMALEVELSGRYSRVSPMLPPRITPMEPSLDADLSLLPPVPASPGDRLYRETDYEFDEDPPFSPVVPFSADNIGPFNNASTARRLSGTQSLPGTPRISSFRYLASRSMARPTARSVTAPSVTTPSVTAPSLTGPSNAGLSTVFANGTASSANRARFNINGVPIAARLSGYVSLSGTLHGNGTASSADGATGSNSIRVPIARRPSELQSLSGTLNGNGTASRREVPRPLHVNDNTVNSGSPGPVLPVTANAATGFNNVPTARRPSFRSITSQFMAGPPARRGVPSRLRPRTPVPGAGFTGLEFSAHTAGRSPRISSFAAVLATTVARPRTMAPRPSGSDAGLPTTVARSPTMGDRTPRASSFAAELRTSVARSPTMGDRTPRASSFAAGLPTTVARSPTMGSGASGSAVSPSRTSQPVDATTVVIDPADIELPSSPVLPPVPAIAHSALGRSLLPGVHQIDTDISVGPFDMEPPPSPAGPAPSDWNWELPNDYPLGDDVNS